MICFYMFIVLHYPHTPFETVKYGSLQLESANVGLSPSKLTEQKLQT